MVRSEPATSVRRLIRAARQRKGWSQADLASAAGIKSRTTIQNLENGVSLREGMEAAVENALELPIGGIDDVRGGRASIEQVLGQESPAAVQPPEPRRVLASIAGEIEYFRGLLGAEDFSRMFALMDALYHERRQRELSSQDSTERDHLDDTG